MSSAEARGALIRRLGEEMRSLVSDTVLFNHSVAERLGLHPTDLQCLNQLAGKGPVTAGQLAESTGLTTGAVTRLVDRLEAAGYVLRRRDPVDRRRVEISVVEERAARLYEAFAPMDRAFHALLDRYTGEELAVMLDMVVRGREMTREQTTTPEAPARA